MDTKIPKKQKKLNKDYYLLCTTSFVPGMEEYVITAPSKDIARKAARELVKLNYREKRKGGEDGDNFQYEAKWQFKLMPFKPEVFGPKENYTVKIYTE